MYALQVDWEFLYKYIIPSSLKQNVMSSYSNLIKWTVVFNRSERLNVYSVQNSKPRMTRDDKRSRQNEEQIKTAVHFIYNTVNVAHSRRILTATLSDPLKSPPPRNPNRRYTRNIKNYRTQVQPLKNRLILHERTLIQNSPTPKRLRIARRLILKKALENYSNTRAID